jgi:hypothetical protein
MPETSEGKQPNAPAATNVDLELRRLESQNRLREIELPFELAGLGLKGTLIGAVAGEVLVAILACIAVFAEQSRITGTHLCIITAIVGTTVGVYGAFVFKRSLDVSVSNRKGVSVGAGFLESEKQRTGG